MSTCRLVVAATFACAALLVTPAWAAESESTAPAQPAAKAPPDATPSPVRFVPRRVGSFRSEACGVADFNNDGRLDIVAGPFWYEAPSWRAHPFRTLRGKVDEAGKGYHDDFANLPLDVDGDGLVDVVTCSWFARQVDWYRNTGPAGGDWPMTVVDKGANHECGELCDIDGDGKANEVLPATPETHWLEPGAGPDGKRTLLRHDVSSKPSPYGGGVGDVNGDGRPDIIRPDAWYEAPADPRKGKWTPHPLALGGTSDARADHTPQILLYDVNADGLPDIVTSTAHGYGIYWHRQVRDGGKISWKRHVIDKSWSQPHSLALADIDGDGDLDLVAGKRFLAHNGGDPGANEPLGVYWYELVRGAEPKWLKHVITYGEGIGSGVNLVVADLDGDGDLDVVVTGKWAGPVLFENQTKSPKPQAPPGRP